jgi:hypothetical protein
MNTALVIREKGVLKNSALAKSEQELYEAMSGAFESFYSQGVILNRINIEKEYKDAGFDSFEKYMNERQPCGIKRSHAWRLIAAMKARPLLPEIQSPNGDSGLWTEGAIRPLLHKDFKPNDQKRIGKKVASAVARGEKLTAALVKSICDDERGVERRKAVKHAEAVAETPTPFGVIKKCRAELRGWIKSLGMVPSAFWEEAESEERGCRKELSAVASELASVLAGVKPARKMM